MKLTAEISIPVAPELASINIIHEETSLLDNTDSDSSEESKDDLMTNSPKILFQQSDGKPISFANAMKK